MSLLNDMLRDLSQQQSHAMTQNVEGDSTALTQLDVNVQPQRELLNQSSVAKPLPLNFIPSAVAFFLVLAGLLTWQFLRVPEMDSGVDHISPIAAVEKATANNIQANSHANGTPINYVSINPVAADFFPSQAVATIELSSAVDERLLALEAALTNLSAVVTNTNKTDSDELISSEVIADIHERTSAEVNEPVSVSIKEPFAAIETIITTETETEILGSTVRVVQDVQLLTAEPAHLAIAPNPTWQDEQTAANAQLLIEQGQTSIAVEKLQNFIAQAEQPRASLKMLLALLSEQKNIIQMQLLLEKSDYLSAYEQAFFSAKIALIDHNDEQAIQLLETHLNAAEQDENYRALLAGLYQKTGKSLAAANHYRRLLTVFGDKPAYWLGYALAQDALNQPLVARQAYQRVNQYSDLQPQVRTYIQQRLTALQQ